jgi:hypothetical protein
MLDTAVLLRATFDAVVKHFLHLQFIAGAFLFLEGSAKSRQVHKVEQT